MESDLAAPDTTDPTLASVSLPTVDVSTAGQTVAFSAGAFDTGSGVDRVVIYFDRSWSGGSGPESVVMLSDAEDSFADGTSSASVYFDTATTAGTYSITSVLVYDQAGNWSAYSPAQLTDMHVATTFEVVSGAPADTTPPLLTSTALPAVDVTAGAETVTFSVGALDTGSGVGRVALYFDHDWQGLTGPENVILVSDTADSFADGTSTASVYFDPSTGAGTYAITAAVVTDLAGNSVSYTTAQLAALGVATSFDVSSNAPADTASPELTALGLPSVDVTSGGQAVAFTAGAFDGGSGVDRVLLSFDHAWQGHSGLESAVALTDLSDSFADGLSAKSVYFDQSTGAGTYSLTSALVYDKAGNWTRYGPADLAAMGIGSSFTVADHNLAPTASVSAPSALVDGSGAIGVISLTLFDVAQWTGSVSMEFSLAGSSAANGIDVLVPSYSASYKVSQPTAANVTIELPSITVPAGSAHPGTVAAISIHATGQVFSTGTDTITVTVRLLDRFGPHNDFDGDGHSDILFQNSNGTVTDWLGRADGTFTGNGGKFSVNIGTAWHVAGTGDFDGDGRVDVLFQNSDGTVTDWLGRADGTFTGNAGKFSVSLGTVWHVIGTGDFNGDGRADVLFQNTDGTVTDWLGRQDGTFTGNAGKFSVNIGTAWHAVGTGDFNGDGRSDVLFQNDDGTITDWLGRADGTFTGNAANLSVYLGSEWHVVATGDFNGDSATDVLLRSDSGAVNEWLGQSNGSFSTNVLVSNNVPAAWHVAGVGDFNGDAVDDVFWQNSDGSITDWLGRPDGTFAGNAFHFSVNLGTTWHVQDPFVHDPLA